MKRNKEFEDAFSWLCCIDVKSEAEASDREMILSTIEQYEKVIDLMAEMICHYDSQLVINSFDNIEDVKELVFKKVKGENDL